MTLTGFCALAALAVARRTPGEVGRSGVAPAGVEELADLQRELFAARNAVDRTGVNLNQAVAALHSTGRRRCGWNTRSTGSRAPWSRWTP